MPKRNTRYTHQHRHEDEEFETEAFSFMNKKLQSDASHSEHSDEDAVEENSDKEDEDIQDVNDDSDDDAPEAIGFHDSKLSALAQVRLAMQQVGSSRKKQREIRQKLDTQYKEQKAKKLEQLSKAKLPEDILEGIDEHIPAKKQKVENVDKTKKNKKSAKKREKKNHPGDQEDTVNINSTVDFSEDFIAFTDPASSVKVAEIKSLEKGALSLAQRAAEFRQNRLYGRYNRRESNKERLANVEKRKQRYR